MILINKIISVVFLFIKLINKMDFEEEHGGDDVEEIQDGEDIFGDDADVSVHDSGSKKDAVIFLVDCKKSLFDMD